MRVRENAAPGGRSLLSQESFAAICSNKSNTSCGLGEVRICIKHFYIEMFLKSMPLGRLPAVANPPTGTSSLLDAQDLNDIQSGSRAADNPDVRVYLPPFGTLVKHWLRNRAELLQSNCFHDDGSIDEKRLALYLRYQTTHERAFHKCLNDLLKLRAEKRKTEIGFEARLSHQRSTE
jgi:hypothetical protein